MIILHGLFGTGDNWRTQSKWFSRHFDVHVLDLRNHGRSPHDSGMTYDLMAADVGWYISNNDLEAANVIGHSMGGKVAMWLALQHGELVDRLVVVDIAPREHPPGHRDILDALCGLNLGLLRTREEADEILARRIESPRLRQFLLKNLHRNRDGFTWKMNLPVIEAGYDAIRGWPGNRSLRSDKPALFVAGTKSDYITVDDSDAIVEVFPQARFVDIDAGHWIHAEQPEAFFKVALEFLKEPR